MVALFARTQHPHGWAEMLLDGYDERSEVFTVKNPITSAHGYSVLAIECDNEEQLAHLQQALQNKEFYGNPDTDYPHGHLGTWFGGHFAFLGTIDGENLHVQGPGTGHHHVQGDNQLFSIFQADEVLQLLAQ
jgi:hypothetical protein